MPTKQQLRNIYSRERKKKYFEIDQNFFKPLINLLNKLQRKKIVFLSLYYPSNYEVNTLKILKLLKGKKNIKVLLPVIRSNNKMTFTKWDTLDVLKINRFGVLEPINKKKSYIPNVALVPLLAYDKNNFRLGYGKGYYDRFFNKYLSLNKDILTIGVAFSFQKYNKLPTSKFDVKLDYILTEKGII
tara:strand:+ start:1275 stop:1832 length:558 start_codon:yes stop_codon:yes gene_type:complete